MLEAVIFDLDGLLVDSEPLQFRAYREAFARHGVTIERADWPRWHELEGSAARWLEVHGLERDAEHIRADKKALYDALIAEELELKPGARELVETLAREYRLCVASGSRIESIRGCLQKFSLDICFEQLFSATAVARKKPYPDVYLEALAVMDVPAGRALAIEDSVTGLGAALAADLRCVVCPDSFLPKPRSAYTGAALIVDSLTELSPGILRDLIR